MAGKKPMKRKSKAAMSKKMKNKVGVSRTGAGKGKKKGIYS